MAWMAITFGDGLLPARRTFPHGRRFAPVQRDSAWWTTISRGIYWPHASALGQRLFEGGAATTEAEAFTVVGVVGAVKQAGLTDQTAQGAVYYPYALRTDDRLFVVVRTSLRPESLGLALQRVVRQIDPSCR